MHLSCKCKHTGMRAPVAIAAPLQIGYQPTAKAQTLVWFYIHGGHSATNQPFWLKGQNELFGGSPKTFWLKGQNEHWRLLPTQAQGPSWLFCRRGPRAKRHKPQKQPITMHGDFLMQGVSVQMVLRHVWYIYNILHIAYLYTPSPIYPINCK